MSKINKTKEQMNNETSKLHNRMESLWEQESKNITYNCYFELIANALPVVFCIYSIELDRVLYVSPAYEKVFGRSCESLYEENDLWSSSIYPEDREIVHSIKKIENECIIQYRIVRPDGAIRWISDKIYPIFDDKKNNKKILRFIEDITESKQVEESLRDSFQRSVEIVNSIPSGLFIYQYKPENQFILIYGNPAAERITGINIDEWSTHKLNDTWVKEHGLLDDCIKVIKTGKTIEIDDLDYHDSRFEGNFRIKIFRLPGEQLGIAFENTTELKKSVEREAEAYAWGRIEMMDTLLHNIGNAINSVTTGIGTLQENITNNKLTHRLSLLAKAIKDNQNNFVDYIQNDKQGQMVVPFIIALAKDFNRQKEEFARIVNRVRERSQHIADIIRTEKVISGRGIYRKFINPQKAIEDVLNLFQESIKKRNINIILECNSKQKEICIQESQFHQMLVNLIKNSIEAIDEFNIKMGNYDYSEDISFKQEDYNPFIKIISYIDESNFTIEISDNGIGIEKDKLELIFRPGYTTKDSGSGRGLHSVANFVSSCGGHINVSSDGFGKGAIMRIIFPLSSVI
jgi:PAS domain S-box-containing protein